MTRSRLTTIFILSALGTVFAASVTLRQLIAPATQPGLFSCVGLSVLGLSPCPWGLGFFAAITALSALVGAGKTGFIIWLRLAATGGVVFSGWVAWRELCLPALQLGPVFWETFSLARVPACAWGFLIFLAVFILVWLRSDRTRNLNLSSIAPL